jgi:putative Holliday junction resolvase
MCIGKPRNYSVAKGFRRLCYSAEVRALGIDYGERRIGLALSDATGLLASPWKTLPNTADIPRAAAELIEEAGRLVHEADGLSAIVVGLPRRLNGEPTEQTARARQLGDLLASALDVPVVLQDERLTSHAADEILARGERDWRARKKRVDAMAAAIILQDYLDGRRALSTADVDPE